MFFCHPQDIKTAVAVSSIPLGTEAQIAAPVSRMASSTERPPATIPMTITVNSTMGNDPQSDTDHSEKIDSSVDSNESGGDLTKSVSTISGASNDHNIAYPSGFRLLIIVLSLCLSVFLVALDQTIIGTAM